MTEADWTKMLNNMNSIAENVPRLEKRLQALETRVEALEGRQPTLPAPAPDAVELREARQEAERLKRERDAAQREAERLKRELDAAQREAESLKRERNDAQEAAEACRGECDDALKAAQKAQRELEPFKELLDVHSRYAATGEKWRKIFPSDTPVRFLVCGARANAITALWEAMRDRCESVGEEERGEWNAVSDALRFLLAQYNSAFDSPVWELADCQPGERFNEERHIRAKNGNQYSGTVEKTLLQGIRNCKDKAMIRKSVVIVK